MFITGVSGMTQINNRLFTVTSATLNSFALQGVDGRNFNTYASGERHRALCQDASILPSPMLSKAPTSTE